MKKQLFALALISLGYIASSHGMGVAIMAEWGKFKKDVVENTSQTVYATAIWIEDEAPVVAGQPVLELEETKKDVWLLKHLNPGTATVHIKKRRSGYSEDHDKAHHHCKPAVITVRASKKRKADDEGTMTNKKSNREARTEMVSKDEDIEMDEQVTSRHHAGHQEEDDAVVMHHESHHE